MILQLKNYMRVDYISLKSSESCMKNSKHANKNLHKYHNNLHNDLKINVIRALNISATLTLYLLCFKLKQHHQDENKPPKTSEKICKCQMKITYK